MLFFYYKLSSKKNYLILLPVLYVFVGLWVALGFSTEYLNDSPWSIQEDHVINTYFIFIVASISFYIGLSVIRHKKASSRIDVERIRSILYKLESSTIILLYVATVFMMHIAYPYEYIYFREGYLPIYGGSNMLKMLFELMVFVLLIVLPFYKSKVGRLLLLVLILILVQGLNKRMTVLLPILYLMSSYVRDSKLNYSSFFILILVSLLFSATAYEYRGNLEQGVISNIIYFYNNGINFEMSLDSINYLFGFSFLSTLVTSSFFDVSLNEFFISINPLPSTIIDVSSVINKHKITVFAPYSALGTLGVLGFAYVSVYYFIAGLIFNFCKTYFSVRFSMASSIIFLLFMSFTMLSLQYQLRTATRFVYYAVFVFLFFKVISSFLLIKKRSV